MRVRGGMGAGASSLTDESPDADIKAAYDGASAQERSEFLVKGSGGPRVDRGEAPRGADCGSTRADHGGNGGGAPSVGRRNGKVHVFHKTIVTTG
jgi:hypothetical protein